MMERDRRLTGSLRGQSVRNICLPFPGPNEGLGSWVPTRISGSLGASLRLQTEPVAPKEFATNSIWQTERIS